MRHLAWLSLGMLVVACGAQGPEIDPPDLPSAAEIEDAKQRAQAAVDTAEEGRAALELLGILPTYDCGEPRSLFVADLPAAVQAEVGCATVMVDSTDPAVDVVTVSFPAGCQAIGRDVSGDLVARVSGGTDRFDLEIDPSALTVDGRTLQAIAGYGTCGDETRYWVTAEGMFPGGAGRTFYLDAHLAMRPGVPIIGGTTLLVTGTGEVRDPAGIDRLTLTEVEYEIGDLFPRSGTILVETASGLVIRATFDDDTPIGGEVTLQIGSHDPVTVPLPG